MYNTLINISLISDVSAAANVMKNVINPMVLTLSAVAGITCAAFIVNAGILYITSAGHPEKLERAKKLIRGALIGLVLVLGAATLTSILSHAYGSPSLSTNVHFPVSTSIKPAATSFSLVDLLIKAITGLLQNVVQTIGKPIIDSLAYFTNATPLMAQNSSVFNMWLTIVAITDIMFVLIVCLIGFNVMGAATFGFDEIDIKHLIPQLLIIFLLINSSIFAIDSIISLSNGMINAIKAAFGSISVWQILSKLTTQSTGLGLATLLIMVVFLVFAFILLIYYVGRLVTLYLGAVLAPLLLLLWLLPSFKDFAASAVKTYLTTIFVLFIHIVILILAASIFASLVDNSSNHTPDTLMSLVVGLSTLLALIKTQGVLSQFNYASIGPKSIRRLSSQFINALNAQTVSVRS